MIIPVVNSCVSTVHIKKVDNLFTLSELKKKNLYNIFKNVFIKPVLLSCCQTPPPRAFGLLFYLGFKQSVAILHDPTSSMSNLERSYKPWDIGHNYCHQTKGVVLLQMGTLSS